jgi:hypothetical protein
MPYLDQIAELGYKTSDERRELICSRLEQLAIPYRLQKGAGGVNNIIVPASQKGTPKIVLCAHYDVYPGSSGYYDNGAAVAMLLDMAPTLQAFPQVEILFLDQEESGGLGSEHYLSSSYGKNILLAINLDIIGLPDTVYYSATQNCPSQTTSLLNDAGALCVRYPFCDFNIFECQNIPAISVITTGAGNFSTQLARSYECMHCGKDDGRLELLDAKMIAHVATLVTTIIHSMKG